MCSNKLDVLDWQVGTVLRPSFSKLIIYFYSNCSINSVLNLHSFDILCMLKLFQNKMVLEKRIVNNFLDSEKEVV